MRGLYKSTGAGATFRLTNTRNDATGSFDGTLPNNGQLPLSRCGAAALPPPRGLSADALGELGHDVLRE